MGLRPGLDHNGVPLGRGRYPGSIELVTHRTGYTCPMARAYEIDRQASEQIGGVLSASQVNRLRSEGLGPALECDDAQAHWQALVPFVGTGRSCDVAALRMAAIGYPTRRLRQVLANPDPDGTRALVNMDTARDLLGLAATRMVGKGTPAQAADLPESPQEEAAVMLGAALLSAEDLLSEGGDIACEDLTSLAVEAVAMLREGADPGWAPYPEEVGKFGVAAASYMNERVAWAESASDEELVESLQLVAALWDGTPVRRAKLGDEDRWRLLAVMAPCAGLLIEWIAEVKTQLASRGHPQTPAAFPVNAASLVNASFLPGTSP